MYNKVNLEFVTELVEHFNHNDQVWVMDIELLMVYHTRHNHTRHTPPYATLCV